MGEWRPLAIAAWRRAETDRLQSLGAGWAFVCILAVLYGSLIPFDLASLNLSAAGGFGLSHIRWCGSGAEDAITNLFVYLPLGALVALTGSLARRAAPTRIFAASVIGVGVSVLAETIQTAMPIRVASWTDVVLNGMGSAMGGLLGPWAWRWARAACRRVHISLRDRPWATTSSILTFGLLGFHLAPFDFVLTTAGLHASFIRAEWYSWSQSGVPVGARMLGSTGTAVWFLLLGYFTVLGARERARPLGVAAMAAIKHGCILALLIEVMQLLTASNVFTASDIAVRSLAVMIGAAMAAGAVRAGARSTWLRRPRMAVPTLGLVALGLGQAVLVLLYSIDAFAGGHREVVAEHMVRIPFEALWRQPMTGALGGIVDGAVCFGVLAITCGVVLRRAHRRWAWAWTGAVVVSVAVLAEIVGFLALTKPADITQPVLALAAVVAVSRIYPAIRSSVAAAQPAR